MTTAPGPPGDGEVAADKPGNSKGAGPAGAGADAESDDEEAAVFGKSQKVRRSVVAGAAAASTLEAAAEALAEHAEPNDPPRGKSPASNTCSSPTSPMNERAASSLRSPTPVAASAAAESPLPAVVSPEPPGARSP